MKNIYCFAGKSGSGKDTIVNCLCDNYGYKRVISWTTRERRYGDEADAKSHIFGTIDDYNVAKSSGSIVAETNFDSNYYWVTKSQVDNADLYIVDLVGLRQLRNEYKDKPIIGIWIGADRDVRRDRMLKRGDSEDKVDTRIENDEKEFVGMTAEDFAITVVNNASSVMRKLCETIHEQIQGVEDGSLAEWKDGVLIWKEI